MAKPLVVPEYFAHCLQCNGLYLQGTDDAGSLNSSALIFFVLAVESELCTCRDIGAERTRIVRTWVGAAWGRRQNKTKV